MEETNEKLVSLAYQPGRRLLAAATRSGKLAVWKHQGAAPADAPERAWLALPAVELERPAELMTWSATESVLAVCGERGLSLLPETVLRRKMVGDWALLQISAHLVTLEHKDGACVRLETDAHVAGCDVHADKLLVWTSRTVFVYQFDDSPHNTLASPPVLLSSSRAARASSPQPSSVMPSSPPRRPYRRQLSYVTARCPCRRGLPS